MSPESATGKTYLMGLLQKYRTFGYPVFGASYSKDNIIALSEAELKSIRLALFDRYDMYYGTIDNEIQIISKNGIVLLDCKLQSHMPLLADTCGVRLIYPNRIEVR